MYLARHAERYQITGTRHRIAQLVRWWLLDKSNVFLFCLRFNGKAVAFMQGEITSPSEIWATKLAINAAKGFYSPGMILVNETIKYLLENTEVRCLNLGRGTEKYKYDMGGSELISSDYELQL